MKKSLLVLLCAFSFSAVSAQDIIMKKNADEIRAKVTEVGATEIKYRKWDNLDGPVYTIPVHDVFVIKYENGTTDKFTDLSAAKSRPQISGKFPRYQGEIAIGYGVGVGAASDVINTNRVVIETVHGARINPYVFVGGGLGINYFYGLLNGYVGYYGDGDTATIAPLFANVKGYCPLSKKTALALSLDMGAAIGIGGIAEGTEFYTSIGPEVQIGKFDLGIRFQHMETGMGTGLNAMLFRVGFTF